MRFNDDAHRLQERTLERLAQHDRDDRGNQNFVAAVKLAEEMATERAELSALRAAIVTVLEEMRVVAHGPVELQSPDLAQRLTAWADRLHAAVPTAVTGTEPR